MADEGEVMLLSVGEEELAILSTPGLSTERLRQLTPAERQVLVLVLQGKSNASIARARSTAERTVANQVASIFRKLVVVSRAELVGRLTGMNQ